ncbi:MAG: putative toxin-antitoxin system toxin component, PIN family [Acidobacteria bacterium]|nr:putative toxin-antitoxin system toxin component, PIN family [Acidobacteriota bacterium]
MKILFDTNVLIASFIARGVCHELFEYCVEHHSLVTSDFILGEFREKLVSKFKYTDKDANDATELLTSRMEVITPTLLDEAVCRDADDDNILAAAISAGCRCIITGDKDLLLLERYQEIDILNPANFPKYEEDNQ